MIGAELLLEGSARSVGGREEVTSAADRESLVAYRPTDRPTEP
jgi:hypothetical protein